MLFHKVTLYIGDPDENGDPGLWDWDRLEVAYLVSCSESIEVKPEDTPFDPGFIAELLEAESEGDLV